MSLTIYLHDPTSTYKTLSLWDNNITGNLSQMANEVGVYECLWNPDTDRPAKYLIPNLEKSLKELKDNPTYYKKFNPSNGWGTYEGLVEFLTNYLEACHSFGLAYIQIYR
tara:strand:+ start:261 stop:590 length:330 start_codon:yes stop_codon:yes gene_type:complete